MRPHRSDETVDTGSNIWLRWISTQVFGFRVWGSEYEQGHSDTDRGKEETKERGDAGRWRAKRSVQPSDGGKAGSSEAVKTGHAERMTHAGAPSSPPSGVAFQPTRSAPGRSKIEEPRDSPTAGTVRLGSPRYGYTFRRVLLSADVLGLAAAIVGINAVFGDGDDFWAGSMWGCAGGLGDFPRDRFSSFSGPCRSGLPSLTPSGSITWRSAESTIRSRTSSAPCSWLRPCGCGWTCS